MRISLLGMTCLWTLFIWAGGGFGDLQAQGQGDGKLKDHVRQIRDNNLSPEWMAHPHMRWSSDTVDPAGEIFKELEGGIDLESLEVSPEESGMLERIIHKKTYLSEQNAPAAISHSLLAVGVEKAKGGIRSLVNIMVEGKIFSNYSGPLTYGMPEYNAGNHGPFYVILDPSQKRQGEQGFPESAHAAYLVPGKAHKEKILQALDLAGKREILTTDEVSRLKDKVITYEEFIQMAESFPTSMESGRNLSQIMGILYSPTPGNLKLAIELVEVIKNHRISGMGRPVASCGSGMDSRESSILLEEGEGWTF